MSRERVLTSGRPYRRPGGTLPALVAATLGTPLLARLPPREQELATIVYLNTSITAKEVQWALSSDITNAAVRCMLNRLVTKGVLRRRNVSGTFFYSPALCLPSIQERALERVADDFFGGSLTDTADRLVALLSRADPKALGGLSQRIIAASSSANPLAATG
jgi:predicted transcriptional regulator